MDGNQADEGSLSDDYLNDSFASVGNSTRSLLSPILNEKLYIKTSTPGKDRQETENEDNEEEEEQKEEKSYKREKSENMVLTSLSLAKRGGENSFSKTKSNRTGSSCSSSFSSSYLESSKHKEGAERENQLSPWESWLIKKTSENREKMKNKKMEESKKKVELEEKEKEKNHKKKNIEEKIGEWIQRKEEMEKIKQEEKRRQSKEQRELEMRKQMEIEEKSQRVYKRWLEEKKAADLETKKKKENEEREKKQKQVEKQMKSEEAFEQWLKKSKNGSGNNSQNYNYRQVGLQGCYDWASYPSPSYINPMPWVPPAPKHRGRTTKKKQLQPVSPPLLFRDYEQRTKKNSRKNAWK